MNMSGTVNNPITQLCAQNRTSNSVQYIEQHEQSDKTGNGHADIVSISSRASAISKAASHDIPKELAIPQWLVGYSHESSILNHDSEIAETRAYHAFSEQLLEDGVLTREEQNQIESYRRSQMPFNDARREMDEFREKHQAELNEFGTIKNTYYQQVLTEAGIKNSHDYVEKVIDAPNHNEEMHKRFDTLLRSDTRAMALMNQLGINPSVVS